mmetsp:Transcript_23246/g.22825  ORF Transcript_23246/g.22825 Transcript_23246/m.22825 type:complete len:119 (-) Transcript_23246:402-758(-)
MPFSIKEAYFFIIKSFTEENLFKSLIHKVWASTKEGNSKMDQIFTQAQGAPVFLLFSVNKSGKFQGVAQMMSQVDFSTNVPFWDNKKWGPGMMEVSWLYVKDIPNKAFLDIRNPWNQS